MKGESELQKELIIGAPNLSHNPMNYASYEFYGVEYFTTILILMMLGVFIIQRASTISEQSQLKLQRILSFVISLAIITWTAIEIILGQFNLGEDLPLIFCNLIALLLPIYTYYNRQWLFEVLYFIILAGAIQSVITPALDYGLPHHDTIKFWIVHGGLIIFVFYSIVIERKLPSWKGILHSFLFVQGYVLLILGVNFLLDANYLFLRERPPTASILDLLGDWPYYIIVMDLILIPYFVILYLPILVVKKFTKGAAK